LQFLFSINLHDNRAPAVEVRVEAVVMEQSQRTLAILRRYPERRLDRRRRLRGGLLDVLPTSGTARGEERQGADPDRRQSHEDRVAAPRVLNGR